MINYLLINFVPNKNKKAYEKYKSIISFLFNLFLFYAFWRIVYHYIWASPERYQIEQNFMLGFASNIVETAVFILDLFRNDVTYIEADRIVRLANSGGVTVSTPCVGFEMLYTFLALIISYPSNWKKKLWFIPLGLISIHTINLVRIISLALMSLYYPKQLDFNHKYVFVVIVYSFIFFMWIKWVKLNESKAIKKK